MSRLETLFESASAPAQSYQKPAVTGPEFSRDPSLNRILSQPMYFEGIPQRVADMADAFHKAIQQARKSSFVDDGTWDFATTGFGATLGQLTNDLAIAGHTVDRRRDHALSSTAFNSLLRQWQHAHTGPEGRAEVLTTLRKWYQMVKAMADNPASDECAPAYARYAGYLDQFCTQLEARLQQGPDADVAQPTVTNTLDVDPTEGLLEESAQPSSFSRALNHTTSDKDFVGAVTWLMQNRSGSVWTGDLINLISGLEDLAGVLRNGTKAGPVFIGALSRKQARDLADVLDDVSSDAQGTLLAGMTKALQETGLWGGAPEDARESSTPRTVGQLVATFSYRDLRNNMLYALSDEGGRAVHRSFGLIAKALAEAASRIERKVLLVELDAEQRATLVDSLIHTSQELERDFGKLKTAFSKVKYYDDPIVTPE